MCTHDAADPTKNFVASTPDPEVELLSPTTGDEEIFITSTFSTVDYLTLYDCLCTDLGFVGRHQCLLHSCNMLQSRTPCTLAVATKLEVLVWWTVCYFVAWYNGPSVADSDWSIGLNNQDPVCQHKLVQGVASVAGPSCCHVRKIGHRQPNWNSIECGQGWKASQAKLGSWTSSGYHWLVVCPFHNEHSTFVLIELKWCLHFQAGGRRRQPNLVLVCVTVSLVFCVSHLISCFSFCLTSHTLAYCRMCCSSVALSVLI